MQPYTAFPPGKSVFNADFITTGIKRVAPTESSDEPAALKAMKNKQMLLALHPFSDLILGDFLLRRSEQPEENVVSQLEKAIKTLGAKTNQPLNLQYWHEHFEPVALERVWRGIKGDTLNPLLLEWHAFSSKVDKVNDFFERNGLDQDDPQDAAYGVRVVDYDEVLQNMNDVVNMKRAQSAKVTAFWNTLSRDSPKDQANLIRFTEGATPEVEEMVKTAFPRLLLKDIPALAFLIKDGIRRALPLTYNESIFSVLEKTDPAIGWVWHCKDAGNLIQDPMPIFTREFRPHGRIHGSAHGPTSAG